MATTGKPASRLASLLGSLQPFRVTAAAVAAAPLLRWRRKGTAAALEAVGHFQELRPDDLLCIDRQKAALQTNTEQFIHNYPANHALLWGPRGTGKSSLVKATFSHYRQRGLRLVEVPREHLGDLRDVCDEVRPLTGKFILFCDDLSFEANDPGYKTLKALLDGSVSGLPDNILVYATSNRRHLVPEFNAENQGAAHVDGEIHHGEAVEEKLSLSERFGIRLAFQPFTQEQYLQIVFHWLAHTGVANDQPERTREAALQWALANGARSGRSAAQFARDWAGKRLLDGG